MNYVNYIYIYNLHNSYFVYFVLYIYIYIYAKLGVAHAGVVNIACQGAYN